MKLPIVCARQRARASAHVAARGAGLAKARADVLADVLAGALAGALASALVGLAAGTGSAVAQQASPDAESSDSAPVAREASVNHPQPYPDTIAVAAAQPDARVSDTGATVLTLPPVVTVGTRAARPIDQVPASIARLDARDLEFTQASNLGEALSELPGVAMEGGPRASGTFLNVRGLSGPRVLIIVDGARQNFQGGHRSSLLVEPELLKQVELLRGPASALWGSDALGGVVVMQTKNAADFLEAGQRIAGRARTAYETVSGERLGSGIVAGRFGAFDTVINVTERSADSYERGDGRQQPNTGVGASSRLFKTSWLPDDGPHSVSISQHTFVQDSISPSNPSTVVTATNPLIDRTNDTTYTTLNYGFDGLGDTVQGGRLTVYRDALFIREDRVDEPRADRSEFITHGYGSHVSLTPGWLGDALLTLGSDGFVDQSRARRDGEPRPQFPDADRRVAGAFLQAEVPLGDWTVVPGVRFDQYHAESNQDDSADIDESALSPKLGVIYELVPGLRLRGSLNSAFRAPGLIEVYAAGQHFLGNNFTPNPGLRPEKARNIEFGVSAELPGLADGHAASLNASWYRNRVTDYIELFATVEEEVPSAQCIGLQLPAGCINRNDDGSINPTVPPIFIGGITSSRNLPSATLRGGELEAGYTIGPVRLDAMYSRVRGRDDATGQPLLTIPADRIGTAVDVTPWQRAGGLLGGFNARLSYTRFLAQDRVPMAENADGETVPVIPTTPAHGVWNLALSWEPFGSSGQQSVLGLPMRAPRLVAGIDNLTDASYRNHLNVIESPGRNLRVSFSAGF